ncbi:hypothetical protein GDO86_012281 [Hymenochirus boettgeri]|uniref:Secreted protein n=1 Tax=Hymenochirus boettgeri TaxID=247094 RepID=A0A8T2ILW6_9PIPI|nr:hypothetical protein GDO86_012281 [Hymenochirus boettgeri]
MLGNVVLSYPLLSLVGCFPCMWSLQRLVIHIGLGLEQSGGLFPVLHCPVVSLCVPLFARCICSPGFPFCHPPLLAWDLACWTHVELLHMRHLGFVRVPCKSP